MRGTSADLPACFRLRYMPFTMPFVSINPVTGEKLRTYRPYSRKAVATALTEVSDAQRNWRELALSDRARHVHALAIRLREDRDALAELIVAEMGKPIAQARAEVEKCASTCDHYARHAATYLKPERPLGAPPNSRIVHEPLGVVLAIMPWNFPYWQVFRAAAPALMSGNTVLLKHSSNVCGCALAIEAVFRDAGVPAGLFRTIIADTDVVPDLIADPRVRAISLTGSTAAGKRVGALAGAALKPCVFELGGSDPYLILEDADVAHAARTCATARLINAGQSCISAKRMIVVETVREEFEARLVAEVARRRVGLPMDPATDVGPMARADLRAALHRQVETSVKAGAALLLGGTMPAGPGFFYPPTVLSKVRPGMPAYHEELFGPVAAVISAKDEAHAIAIANDTPYGLGAAIFTRNRRRGAEIAAHSLDVGMTCVNDFVRSDPHLPFGGTKESGYGRELGRHGILSFVNTKTVWVK